MIISGIVPLIKENNEIKGYKQTVGQLLNRFECYENKCSAIYTYEVDNQVYNVINQKNSTYFPLKEIVYYNPNNHKESKIKSTDNIWFIMTGTTILFILNITYIIKTKLKKSTIDKTK